MNNSSPTRGTSWRMTTKFQYLNKGGWRWRKREEKEKTASWRARWDKFFFKWSRPQPQLFFFSHSFCWLASHRPGCSPPEKKISAPPLAGRLVPIWLIAPYRSALVLKEAKPKAVRFMVHAGREPDLLDLGPADSWHCVKTAGIKKFSYY